MGRWCRPFSTKVGGGHDDAARWRQAMKMVATRSPAGAVMARRGASLEAGIVAGVGGAENVGALLLDDCRPRGKAARFR